eukprot:gene9598-11758_t
MKIERNESIFLEILFLRTLYANKKAVWWTSVIQILATLVIYVKTDHPIYAAFALAFFLIVLGRTANASAFERKDLSSATMADLRTWEWRYLLGAISTCILLGLLCLVSIYVLADPSAAITSVAIVVASMVALVTRNYVSPTVVIGMSIGILAPLFLTFVLLGGIYNWLLALLILPYFWSNIRIASKLRQSLWDALLGKQQLSVVVSHFDAALNGMPQGLLMFDRNQTITVANMKAAKMMGFDEPEQVHGHSLQSLLRLARVKAYFPEETQASLSGKMQDLLSGRKERDMFMSPAKRHYEFTATPDPQHGTVLIFQDVTRRAEAEAQISRMARYDSLTGLPNRSQFAEIARTYTDGIEPGTQIALMVVDVDGLKRTNDTFGHRIGDELLRAFADRLASIDVTHPVISRFGSDEFVLLFSAATRDDVLQSVERIMAAISGQYTISGHDILTGAHAGVVIVCAAEFDLAVMHMNADLALDVAKKDSQKQWVVFVETMDHSFRSKQRLKSDLRKAIAEGTLSVAYQPIINAIKDCSLWGSRIAVSINLSSHDLQNMDMADIIRSALHRHNVEPELIEVEVTEGAIITDREATGGVLQSLKLLRGIVQMTHELGLSVTIEGLETREQFALINRWIGAEYVQGFLYGAATTAENIAKNFDIEMVQLPVKPRNSEIAAAS